MIEQLAKLALKAKAKSIHLTIIPMGEDSVQVVLNVENLPCTISADDEETMRVRAALATPLIVRGSVGEMDVFMVEELTKYADSYIPASIKLSKSSNTDKVSSNISKNSKSSTAKKSVTSEKIEAPELTVTTNTNSL
jgi:hypothetical protein